MHTQLLTLLKPYILIAGRTADIIDQHNWCIKVVLFVAAALAPLQDYVHFLIALLLTDVATSIYAQYEDNIAKVIESKPNFHINAHTRFLILLGTVESKKARKTVEKFFSYILGFILCYFFDLVVLRITPLVVNKLNYFSVTNIAIVMICSVEMISVLANLGKITKNPIFEKLIKIFSSMIADKIKEGVK